MDVIELQFTKGVRGLAGIDKGLTTYKEQIKTNYTGTNKLTLKFPDHIELVSSTFVHGLFDDWIHMKGYQWIKDNIIIESTSDYLISAVWDRLY